MFVDKVRISLTAGRGGNGVIAWRREAYIPKGGPSGGDGGDGGSILLQVDPQMPSLEWYRNRKLIKASSGQPGRGNLCRGKSGEDIILKVPSGTLIKDVVTGELLFDFVEHNRNELICKGGRGGKGNNHFKTPTHQAPYVCTEGTEGETKTIELELKLIADIGLVGMPNAGKSSLMRCMTHVEVKVGAYPFTTLFPSLGYIHYEKGHKLLVADIPGIIEGAHTDRGLGLEFLRHIERSSILVYVLDIAGSEGRDPLEDFLILESEIRAYNPALLEKPSLVVLNKMDLPTAQDHVDRFRHRFPSLATFPISAADTIGISPLTEALRARAGRTASP